jgi:1-acyl-sn-glycerol-3-phosphate acyltransferase
MTKLFYAIWKFWAIIVFLIVGILFLPLLALILFIPGKKSQNIGNIWFKIGGYLTLILLGIIPVIKGEKGVIRDQKFVYVANHKSYLDIVISVILISKNTRFLGKAELFKWPIIGYFSRRLGHIPVDRSNMRARKESLDNIMKNVAEGCSLMIYPEGGILNNTKILNSFKLGAFKTAIQTQTPVLPFIIYNAGILNPSKGGFKIRPGKLDIKILEPISIEGFTEDQSKELAAKTFEVMHAELEKYYPNGIYPLL